MNNNQEKSELKISAGGYSTAGQRPVNQDAFAVKEPSSELEKNVKGIVACVADGVSCNSPSQQASHTSVAQFINDYYSTNQSWDVKQSATTVLNSLNSWLYKHNKLDVHHDGLMTTFSSVVIKSNTAHLLHVGDSRIYLYRNGELLQLSHDHHRAIYNQNSILTRALGMDCGLDIDYQTLVLQTGDLFMLCSDGVHDHLDKPALNHHLQTVTEQSTAEEIEQLAHTICDDALAQGSSDNITCLLVQITSLPNADLKELFTHLNNLIIPPALQIGNEIDGFKITKILHEGPRSHVYLATHKRTQALVVLKMPSLKIAEDLDYLLGFYKEQWVGQSIKHPNIMSIEKNIKDSVFLYHICEHIEGITLREWMQQNPQPELQKVHELIMKIVDAARVLQRAGMVHRDLKPENILITTSHDVKLIDFGTVKISGFEDIVKEQQDEPLGAVDYIAPEYLNKGESSALSDLFSIAVIAYEMLSGHLPYPANQGHSLEHARHYTWIYQSIHQHREDLPIRLDNVFKKALHPMLSERYSSMSEFVIELIQSQNKNSPQDHKPPLLEGDPVKYWKVLAYIFMGVSVVELFLLLSNDG
jgi:protein phosphatase